MEAAAPGRPAVWWCIFVNDAARYGDLALRQGVLWPLRVYHYGKHWDLWHNYGLWVGLDIKLQDLFCVLRARWQLSWRLIGSAKTWDIKHCAYIFFSYLRHSLSRGKSVLIKLLLKTRWVGIFPLHLWHEFNPILKFVSMPRVSWKLPSMYISNMRISQSACQVWCVINSDADSVKWCLGKNMISWNLYITCPN